MRHEFILLLLMLSSVIGLYGGGPTNILVSNDNPVVGETVTFTLIANGSCPGTNVECLETPSTNILTTPVCSFFGSTMTITQKYEVVGNFPVILNCEIKPSIKIEKGSSSNKSNAAPVLPWILTNASGTILPFIVVSAAPSAVPTLSEWGLIILALGMLLFGIVAVRQRLTSEAID